MVEFLRIVLGVLLVASLATIVVYVVALLAVTAWTALTSHRRDPLADELDRALAEIFELQAGTAPAVKHGRGLGGVLRPVPVGELPDPFALRRFS